MMSLSIRAQEIEGVYQVKIVARMKGRSQKRRILRGVKPEDLKAAVDAAVAELAGEYANQQNPVL